MFRGKLALWMFVGLVGLAVAAPNVVAQTTRRGNDQDKVFSGPLPGEPLAALPIRGVFGAAEDQTTDVMEKVGDAPVMLVFINGLTRPSVGLARVLMKYAESHKDAHSALIFLSDDFPAMKARLARARHALPTRQVLGVSPDGKEGPGPYGLNRNVAMTVLVGKSGKTTANFALVQPSIQVDGPKIAKALHEAVGAAGKPPTAAQLSQAAGMATDRRRSELTGLLRRLIQKDNTEADVEAAAAALRRHLKKSPAAEKELREIVARIVSAGRLDQYGTEAAREVLKAWAPKAKAEGDADQGKRDDGVR